MIANVVIPWVLSDSICIEDIKNIQRLWGIDENVNDDFKILNEDKIFEA